MSDIYAVVHAPILDDAEKMLLSVDKLLSNVYIRSETVDIRDEILTAVGLVRLVRSQLRAA